MAPKRNVRFDKINLNNSEWFDLEVKQCVNSKTQFETAKKKQENVDDWNFVPPMGHSSDVVKYRNEDNEDIIAVIATGGQDWQDPNRSGQISADIFIKELLVSPDEVAGLGPFKQIKAIKAISSKQTLSMAGGAGSMIRPLKNSSLTVVKADPEGNFEAVLAFGEFIEAGGLSNMTSDLFYKICGNAKESEIEEVTLFATEKPTENPLYGKLLPDAPVLTGHKPSSRRGQTACKVQTRKLYWNPVPRKKFNFGKFEKFEKLVENHTLFKHDKNHVSFQKFTIFHNGSQIENDYFLVWQGRRLADSLHWWGSAHQSTLEKN